MFTAVQEPAGEVTLIFSDNATIRLSVECLEAQIARHGSHLGRGRDARP